MNDDQAAVNPHTDGNMVVDDLPVSVSVDKPKAVSTVMPDATSVTKKDVDDSFAPVAANRVRRRSTSSRSSRLGKSSRSISITRRRHRRYSSTRSSSSGKSCHRRSRYRRSRSRIRKQSRSHSRSRSRSISYRRRRRSSRTPSYRPPPRRRPFGRPRRFSPPFSRRDRAGPTRRSPVAHHARPSPARTRPLSPPPTMQRSRPTKSSPPPAPMPPLSVRFENVVKSTLRRGLREYGVLGGLAHLILTNRCKLPLPTLMREAKELSVVIDRNLPPDITDPNAKISFNVDMSVKLLIPYPPNAGAKPVFNRPEIPVYKTSDDEKKIAERIVAALKAEQAENHTSDTNHRSNVISERNQNAKRGSAFSRLGPVNPLEVPKGSAYFMHDDRDEPYQTGRNKNFRSARRRRDNFDGYQSSRRGQNDRGAGRSNRFSRDEGQWCHDKFLELEEGEKKGNGDSRNGHNRPSPQSSQNETPFLKFKKVETAVYRNGSFTYFGADQPIVIDGMFPLTKILIVELINDAPPTVEFHCIVDKLSRDSPITNAQLCFKTPSALKPKCDNAIGSSYLLSNKYKFKSSGDIYNGYVFTSYWDRDKFPLDATYFCRLGNRNGVIQSNTIDVYDLDSYVSAFLKRNSVGPSLRGPLIGSSFPMYFECGSSSDSLELPNWAKDTFPAPYVWAVCESEPGVQLGMRDCYDHHKPIGEYFEHTVLSNGTLIIHELVKDYRPLGIICTTNYLHNKIFSAYFQNDDDKGVPFTYTPGVYPNKIIPKSPLYNYISIRGGWHARDVITLNALYTANPQNVSAKWTKDGGSIPFQFTATRHSLIFPQDIKFSFAGTYALALEGPFEPVYFQYDVVITKPPTIKEAPPRYLIVPQGNVAQISAEFDGRLTSRNFMATIAVFLQSLLINGMEIDALSSSNYRESLRMLGDAFPYIRDLNPEIEFPSDNSIRYTVRDLTFLPNSPYGSSHTVSMVGTNALGSVRTNTLIRVLPKPEVIRQLSDYSCLEECFNQTTHRFYCDIELAPYVGLRVIKTWELDGQDLARLDSQDNRLMFLKYSNTEVVMDIAADNALFDDLFANAYLSCRFRVFGPETELFAGDIYETPYYDTKNDPTLHSCWWLE
ncbi:unnamed protein product [Rodentolepis nana]|uniref:Btz domain-containing protein n=1 Tax=Rodentolepis nana TaxID=102285 RepID=A0A0R3TVF5_RODNA|nr:unnamed protein product [Rodentolepis nana]